VKNITIDCSISSSFSFLFSYLSLFGKYNFIIFFSFQPNFKAINSCENSNITVNNDKPNDNGENIFIPDQEGKDNDI
jgi:hypothetical protein